MKTTPLAMLLALLTGVIASAEVAPAGNRPQPIPPAPPPVQVLLGLFDTDHDGVLSAEEIKSICTAENHDEPLATPATSTGWYESWMR